MTKSHSWSLAALVALLGATGCSYGIELAPAPGANLAADTHGAVATSEGVEIVAVPQAWKGEPYDLGSYVTPMRVVIRNASGRKLRVSYPQFKMVTDRGFGYGVMPPFTITRPGGPGGPGACEPPRGSPARLGADLRGAGGSASAGLPPVAARFRHRHFHVAPHLHPYYGGVAVWSDPFYDPFYWPYAYDYYVAWRPALPTDDMVQEGLPEGVIDDGGEVDGFLYFQRLPTDVERAVFTMDLIDAASGERFGEVAIPFVRED